MHHVRGRREGKEGKPFQLCTNFGHGPKDAGHRGGGFQRLRLMPPTLALEILTFEFQIEIRNLKFEIGDSKICNFTYEV